MSLWKQCVAGTLHCITFFAFKAMCTSKARLICGAMKLHTNSTTLSEISLGTAIDRTRDGIATK